MHSPDNPHYAFPPWRQSDDDDKPTPAQEMASTNRTMALRTEQDYLMYDSLTVPSYELEDNKMRIHDVVWGSCELDGEKSDFDELLVRLARTPLFRRLQSIEQLTLGRDYATMPNSTDFSRWQHIWGSLVFVRKMTEGTDIPHREREIMQLRTLLSDVGHTAYSHLGDWLFQEDKLKEDLHDEELKELLAATGVENLLAQYGYSIDETVFPETEDWVECPSPNLCVDRVDYGVREILRWGAPTIPLHLYMTELQNPKQLFAINENNQLVVTNDTFGKYLAAGFSILPTEHWSHPVHRLQLELFQSAVRMVVMEENPFIHPRDVMYSVDPQFSHHYQKWPLTQLNDTMRSIALSQRRTFVRGRRHDLNQVFMGIDEKDWRFPEFPDPLRAYSWESEQFVGPYPPNVEFIPAEHEQLAILPRLTATSSGLSIPLSPLKARAIDPLIGAASKAHPLSERDPSYIDYLAGQRREMARGYIGTVCMRESFAERIVNIHNDSLTRWNEQLAKDRNMQRLAQDMRDITMGFAAGGRFDHIHEL